MTKITVRHATVDIPIFDASSRSLKTAALNLSVGGIMRRNQGGPAVVRALTDINLDLSTGDRLGLLGHNGAGKSTLLRLLGGIYEPTAGSVEIVGRVATLFDVSLGFNSEATGYDNIRMGGHFLGMNRKEIEQSIPDIAEFSELGEFLDLPIRTYSQGMLARLSFSLATCVTPDILILDEAIGAGDAAFMSKAKERMRALIDRAGILVLASHDLEMVRAWCPQSAILVHGSMISLGPTADMIDRYLKGDQVLEGATVP